MPVRIVTDSTASLPVDLCHRLGITVIPVPIHFGSETFMAGVDPVEQYYDWLQAAKEVPTTATPAPGVFAACYEELMTGGDEVVSIHVMGSKSGLVDVARMGAQMLPRSGVHVVDSCSLSMGLGLLVMAAARAAQAGCSAQEIVALVERLRDRAHLHAAIPQLTQLRRSGRVSLGQAMLAGLLSIKPILYAGQSVVEVIDKARGWPSALARAVELAQRRVEGVRVQLAVVHTNAKVEAEELLAAVRHRFDAAETMVAEAGPALATHAGPGVLGIVTLEVEEATVS